MFNSSNGFEEKEMVNSITVKQKTEKAKRRRKLNRNFNGHGANRDLITYVKIIAKKIK